MPRARYLTGSYLLPAKQVFLCSFDSEASDVVLRFRRIEGLAHHHEGLRAGRRRSKPDILHQFCSVGREVDLLGDGLVVDVTLDLAPTLHLGENPHRERVPGEWI